MRSIHGRPRKNQSSIKTCATLCQSKSRSERVWNEAIQSWIDPNCRYTTESFRLGSGIIGRHSRASTSVIAVENFADQYEFAFFFLKFNLILLVWEKMSHCCSIKAFKSQNLNSIWISQMIPIITRNYRVQFLNASK